MAQVTVSEVQLHVALAALLAAAPDATVDSLAGPCLGAQAPAHAARPLISECLGVVGGTTSGGGGGTPRLGRLACPAGRDCGHVAGPSRALCTRAGTRTRSSTSASASACTCTCTSACTCDRTCACACTRAGGHVAAAAAAVAASVVCAGLAGGSAGEHGGRGGAPGAHPATLGLGTAAGRRRGRRHRRRARACTAHVPPGPL
jgi:hypothetical protein